MNLPSISMRWRTELAPHGKCAKCGHAFTAAEKEHAHPQTVAGGNRIDHYCEKCCWCWEEDK